MGCMTVVYWLGLFSCLIREQAQMAGEGSKWMVMDGDIDPMWIESLNTVMDDNKVIVYVRIYIFIYYAHVNL